jgi:hypothetical protein
MILGDVVMILGELDKRIRDKVQDGLLLGTLEQFLVDDQVSVILPDGDLWVGNKRDIAIYEEDDAVL